MPPELKTSSFRTMLRLVARASAAAPAAESPSADSRERIADEHVDHTGPSERGVQENETGRVRRDLADDRRIGSERMRPECGERRVRLRLGDYGYEFPLVRDVERVDPENL